MATCFRCGATYPDLTVHHCGTGAAMYVQVPDRYAEGYTAGRIAALREVGHTDPMCGLFKVDGNEHRCCRCRLLAEAESETGEVGA